MIVTGAEATLMGLALALYLQDTVQLLGPDEFMLVRSWRGRWTPRFGAMDWTIGGREPWVPALLAPWQPARRVRWDPELGLAGTVSSPAGAPADLGPALRRAPGVMALVLLLLVFVALPACLLGHPGWRVTLAVAVAIYLSAAGVMALLARDRARLGLARGEFARLCIEGLACPPYAIGAVRKASLRASGPEVTLAGVAAALPEGEARAAFLKALAARVDRQIEAEREGSERMARLRAARATLAVPEEDAPALEGTG